MHFFYSEVIWDQDFILDGEEAIHANVLRLKPRERIAIVNGKGVKCIGIVHTMEKKAITGKIIEKIDIPSPDRQLCIALSPTKNIDRYEWFIEKATELGGQSFIPLITFQSERRQLNLDRMRKIILASMKQSGRAFLPGISEPIALKDFLVIASSDQKIISHITGKSLIDFSKMIPLKSTWTVLIGPEGDFTENELKLAMNNGFVPVSLGDYRLRTETAGLKIVSILGQ